MVAAQRETPLSKEELQTLRALTRRLLVETDREKFKALVDELRRIVEEDPSKVRPN